MKFQNNGAFQNPEPATWLFTVCRNGALNVGRKERRMQYLDEKLIDAGEIDAGHTVTAFYEVVPAEASANAAARMPPLDSRQHGSNTTHSAQESNEMLTVKLRYKKPNDDKSELVKQTAVDEGKQFASASPDFKFAAAVAEFGMLLHESEFRGNGTVGAVLEWAQEGQGTDVNGYRAGFVDVMRKAQALTRG